jgi:hypothetical protein
VRAANPAPLLKSPVVTGQPFASPYWLSNPFPPRIT